MAEELPIPAELANDLKNLALLVSDVIALKTQDETQAIAVLWVALASALAHSACDTDELDREFADGRALVDTIREGGKREFNS